MSLDYPIRVRFEIFDNWLPGVREELKGQNLSFTDIAKLVGERWKVLDPEEKESYEFQASVAKEKYNSEYEEYKRTEQYQEYMRYLADFKAKTSKESKNSDSGPSASGGMFLREGEISSSIADC